MTQQEYEDKYGYDPAPTEVEWADYIQWIIDRDDSNERSKDD